MVEDFALLQATYFSAALSSAKKHFHVTTALLISMYQRTDPRTSYKVASQRLPGASLVKVPVQSE